MRLIELTIEQFDTFAANHPLRNYCQNSKYAKLMGEKNYNYDYMGYYDDSNTLVGASLILYKKLGAFNKYAYAPKGFLIDYYNTELLKMFLNDICDYYKKKGFIFIKINPEIIIGSLNSKTLSPEYNQNVKIIDDLKDAGFKRRREVTPLDFIMPRISPYINLKDFDINKLDSENKDHIKQSIKKGLSLEVVTNKEINILYEFIKDHTYENINFYRNLLNTFGENSEIFLIKIDYESYLISAREKYDKELEHNNECNERIQNDNNEANLDEKMQSDRDLLSYKNDIIEATEGLKKEKYKYIGGAIVVKYLNRVSIIVDGYSNFYENLYPYSYLINALIEKYRNYYDYLDLNGFASDLSVQSIYFKFNQEKLAFKPTLYEFIGEFDIILNEYGFKYAQSKNLLAKEFIPSHKF
jgi:lipid II:glycine glycyltransferase (peptidoglycan interpeptide bridge formation enzyme)